MGSEDGPVSALFPDAVRVPIHSYLNPQDQHPPGSESIEAFSSFSSSTDFPRFLVTMQTTLNKYDHSGTFRNLDREVVIRRTALNFLQILKEHRIEALLFDHTPHSFESLLMHSLGKELNLPRLYFEEVKYAPVCLPLVEIGADRRFLAEASGPHDFPHGTSETAHILKTSLEDYVEKMGIDREVPSYMAFTVQKKTKRRLLERALEALRPNHYLDHGFFPSFKSLHPVFRHLGTRFLSTAYRANFLRALEEKNDYVFGENSFALFALQYEPERTSLPEGLPILHQIDALVEARRVLPKEITLVVKEHPTQLNPARQGIYSGRSTFFYDVVNSMNNTHLLGSGPLAKKILRSASVVFTLTGTVAVEAALRGVPALYFGSPWFAGMPGTKRLDVGAGSPRELADLSPPTATEREILDFLLERLSNFGIPFASDWGSDSKLNRGPKRVEEASKSLSTYAEALENVLELWLSQVGRRGS